MYHRLRSFHRWIGLFGSIFLAVISATGFLLATKGSIGWIRPPESDGSAIESLAELVTNHQVAEAAFSLNIPELRSMRDIDRIDYRPKSNVFKVVSKEGYHEVQVDGTSGKVLQVAKRNDQLAEDIHDMSYFADALHKYGLPVVAVILFCLAVTGIIIFTVPVVRRWRFKRSQGDPSK